MSTQLQPSHLCHELMQDPHDLEQFYIFWKIERFSETVRKLLTNRYDVFVEFLIFLT